MVLFTVILYYNLKNCNILLQKKAEQASYLQKNKDVTKPHFIVHLIFPRSNISFFEGKYNQNIYKSLLNWKTNHYFLKPKV